MQIKSQCHQSDSHILSSSHQTQSCAEPDDLLEENSPSADSLQTMQCKINDSVSMIQGLDNELKQTEKKKNLLLKKHHLASVQRKIQVLQSQDVNKPLVDDPSDLKADYTFSILKHTQFIAFIKRSAENYLSTLKVQLMSYNEKQLIMHFFTKLQSEIRKILLNY